MSHEVITANVSYPALQQTGTITDKRRLLKVLYFTLLLLFEVLAHKKLYLWFSQPKHHQCSLTSSLLGLSQELELQNKG